MTTKGTINGGERAAKSAAHGDNAKILQDGVMGAISQAGQNYLYAMAAMNDAAAQMAAEQMSANMKAADTLGKCRDFGEAMQAHSNLMKSSSEVCMRGLNR